MSQIIINTGNVANDGAGDPLRTAFNDVNYNFTQLFNAGLVDSNLVIANNTIQVTNTNGNLILATNGIGSIVPAANFVPDIPNVRYIGSATNPFNTVYTRYLNTNGAAFSGNVYIAGNLEITGNTITNNYSNANIANLNIILAGGSSNAVLANGAGIIINSTNANLIYNHSVNTWKSSISITAPSFYGDGANLTNVTANVNAINLLGNTLQSAVLFSNLTSLGTIIGLSAVGNISTTGNVYANVITGNIVTGSYLMGDGSNIMNITASSIVGNVPFALNANSSYTANLAALATQAINADTALFAINANLAAFANNATFAQRANSANYSIQSDNANSAVVAGMSYELSPSANISLTGNITTSGYFIGNGSQLTGIVAVSTYGNSNVADYLPTYLPNYLENYTADISANEISAYGNIVAGAFYGDGSNLTNLTPSNTLIEGGYSLTIENDGSILPANNSAPSDFIINNTTPDLDLRNSSGTGSFTTGATDYTIRVAGTPNWIFDASGNLTLPGNASSINYANGQPFGGTVFANTVGSFGSDMGVGPNYGLNDPAILFSEDDLLIRTGGTANTGYTNAGQIDIAASEQLYLGLAGNLVDVVYNPSYTSYIHFESGGNTINAIAGNNYLTVDATNGLTYNGSVIGGNYDNANVVSLLSNFGSNIISTTGNITANYFVGDGSGLSNLNVSSNKIVNGTSYANIDSANASLAININSNEWSFDTAGSLNFPAQGTVSGAAIAYANSDRISFGTTAGNVSIFPPGQEWIFDSTGNITLPNGGQLISASGPVGLNHSGDGVNFLSNSYVQFQYTNDYANADPYNQTNTNWAYVDGSGFTVTANSTGTDSVWRFDTDGNLTSPGYVSAETFILNNAGNGTVSVLQQNQNPPLGTEAFGIEMLTTVTGNPNVYSSISAGPDYAAIQSTNAGNANIVLQGGYGITFSTSNATGGAVQTWTFEENGTTQFPGDISTTGNVIGNYIKGNGGLLSNITVSGGTISTTGNVSGGNVLSTGNISASGNIYAQNFIGNLSNGGSKISIANNGNVSVGIGVFGTTVLNVNTSTGISISGNVLSSGYVSATGNITTSGKFIGDGSSLTNVATKSSGSWTLATGTNTVSFTVTAGQTYSMWVSGNITNGIVVWNATATLTNTNVPVIGQQFGWYYAAGNALVLTSMPSQIIGTAGSISNASPAVANTNVFNFTIVNNSGSSQTVYYGWTQIS